MRKIGRNQCNETVVSVWRRNGANYNMIVQTILAPADLTNQGPRFQYIHNQVIRVKKGDHIGTHSTACWNVISATGTGGWRGFSEGLFGGDRQVSASPAREKDLALRAFVAGVLFQLYNSA